MKLRIGQPVVFTFSNEHQSLIDAIRTLLEFKLLPYQSKPAHEAMFQYAQAGYLAELMWFMRDQLKLWRRTDYPFKLPMYRGYESGGQAMVARLNLCDKVLDFLPPNALPYNTAIPFWIQVELERKIDLLITAYQGLGKRELEDEDRSVIKKLKNWENPYRLDDFLRIQTYNLISIAINIGKPQNGDDKQMKRKRKNFEDEVWKPYLSKLEKILKDSQEGVRGCEFKSFHVEGDNLVVHLGGRQTELIYSPPKTNISNRGRKSTKQKPNIALVL